MRYCFSLIFAFCCFCLHAQTTETDSLVTVKRVDYADSIRQMRRNIWKSTITPQMSAYNQYRLFAPSTFYHAIAKHNLYLYDSEQDIYDQAVDDALLNIYLNHPEYITNSEQQLRDAGGVDETITSPIRTEVNLEKKEAPTPQEVIDAPVDVVITKPNFWTYKGDQYLQFLQNYISGNWYKGGESNYSMVASVTLEANYNNKQKVKWDNKLEMKLGFQTSKADTMHSLKTSEDLVRLTSKLGLQATKNWYYTLSVLGYTQFMRGFKKNDIRTYSDFMSPFNLNISIGMNYTVNWLKKKLTGNIQLSPLAYNFRYVGRDALITRYGLKEGHHTLHDLGSMCTVDLTWKFSDNINWKTRLYGYSTYHRAELEWENTFTFQFNKYISSKLFIYPRFDDATTRDGHHAYWQYKEYASLGFNYSF
ncbi:MAG: DUF3078 domain-containing protein [Prevotella sp.]|nr:DUF3078 domain-containing protein [Prevotella sp.]MBR6945779.1 DUF3078 domain-containing protein [Prevotella sp.]